MGGNSFHLTRAAKADLVSRTRVHMAVEHFGDTRGLLNNWNSWEIFIAFHRISVACDGSAGAAVHCAACSRAAVVLRRSSPVS